MCKGKYLAAVAFAVIALGCARREAPRAVEPVANGAPSTRPASGRSVIAVGQPWADACAAARAAGYRLNDGRGLEWASRGPNGEVGVDGFYVMLPGDTQLIVFRNPKENAVGGLHLQGNASKPKMERTHSDPGTSFELPPAGQAGR